MSDKAAATYHPDPAPRVSPTGRGGAATPADIRLAEEQRITETAAAQVATWSDEKRAEVLVALVAEIRDDPPRCGTNEAPRTDDDDDVWRPAKPYPFVDAPGIDKGGPVA